MIKTIAAYEYEVNAHFVVEQLRHAGLKAEYNKNELEIETEYVVRVLEEDASRAMAILEGLTIDDSFVEEGVDILEILHEEQKYILEEAEYDEGDSIFGYKLLGPLFIIVGLILTYVVFISGYAPVLAIYSITFFIAGGVMFYQVWIKREK